MSAASLADRLVARVGFPLTNYLMNRRGIVRLYEELKRTEQAPPEQLEALQLERLRRTLAHAAQWVPWYRRLFRDIGFDPRDLKSLGDLRRIPPLTRQDVIDHHREMVDERQRDAVAAALDARRDAGQPLPFARFRRHRLVRNNSSGSTGAPTVFFEDGSVTALNWALEMRLKRWFGVEPGTREARMVRLSTVYAAGSGGNRWRRRLWHQLILPGINLRDAEYAYCVEQLEAFRPEVLWGFTGAIAGLAEYLRRRGSRLSFRPRVVIGWAAPVYDHERELMREVYDSPVSNIYGSREVGHLALQCPHGRFHVNQEYMILESEPLDDGTAPPGAGELLATTLVPTPMPFIRYRMGDVGRLSSSGCPCGRTLQVLEEFVGRTGEIFITRDGRMIPPNFWCRLFMARAIAGAVRRFQIRYTRDGDIVVRIVRGGGFTDDTEQYLARVLRDNFAPATDCRIEYVDAIEPTISGKYLMVSRES